MTCPVVFVRVTKLSVVIGNVPRGVNGGAHAIAAHARRTGELYLFDPNYGIFKANANGALLKGIAVLMTKIWPALEKWKLDEENGYAVFKTAPPSEPTPAGQTAVQFVHGYRATYLANKASLRL